MTSLPVKLFAFILLTSTLARAFYLPGIAMKEFNPGDTIEVLANKLTSPTNTLPYPYYSLPLCAPSDAIRSKPVNLGQVLVGERAFPTAFKISMMQETTCQLLCTIDMATQSDAKLKSLINRIKGNYSARLNVDNMPLVTRFAARNGQPAFRFGYNIGYASPDTVFINNHLSLKILYHQPSLSAGEAIDALAGNEETYRIVGFEVQPRSIRHTLLEDGTLAQDSCSKRTDSASQTVTKDARITFTYDVQFERSDLAWATRWDPLLDTAAGVKQVQWFSIINSVMVSLFLTALVASVILRTVLKDFGRYNAMADDDDEDDMTGWKYVHGDVFRPPRYAPFLCICVGSGMQVLVMAGLTQVFALVGFLSPANRGGLLTALLSLWVLSSSVSGFVSAKLYSAIDTGTPRRAVTFGTAFLFPGITFGIFFLLNIAMWVVGSSGGVPFTTLLLLLFMWFGISVPLVFVGAYAGYRQKAIEFSSRTNQIQRQIPPPPFGVSPYAYMILAGILPFGTVFMELVFILNSVWSGSVYYLYGALVAVFVILVITCAEMSIVSTYLSLSAEDWSSHWHTSFWGCGSSGVYMLLYSLYFAFAQPNSGQTPFVNQLIFVSWSLVVSGAFALMCGAVGFVSSLWFTKKIYGSIRID